MSLHQLLLYGFETFATFFVLGVASVILEAEDDDDDFGGGKLIPCHQQSR